MISDNANQSQLVELRSRIKSNLEQMIRDAERAIKYLDRGDTCGVLGTLQNTWEVYLLIGQLQEAEMTRKMFDAVNKEQE